MENDKKENLIAGLILAGMASSMLIPLIRWFINDPTNLFRQRMGFNEVIAEIPFSWVLAIITAVAYIFYTAYFDKIVRQNLFKFNLLKIVGIYAAIVSGIFEEIFFRQMLMDWLQNIGTNVFLQIVVSAIAFGVAHGLWGLFSQDRSFTIAAVASTTILGLLLAITYIIGGRNVLPAIVAHMLINLFIEPWLILSAVKTSNKKAN